MNIINSKPKPKHYCRSDDVADAEGGMGDLGDIRDTGHVGEGKKTDQTAEMVKIASSDSLQACITLTLTPILTTVE